MNRYDLALNKTNSDNYIMPGNDLKKLAQDFLASADPTVGFGTPRVFSGQFASPLDGWTGNVLGSGLSVPNLREYRMWLRHFYQTNMAVVNYIDTLVHESVAMITRLPRGFTGADLHHAAHEFYLFGNAYMMPHPRGGWTFFDPNDIRVRPVPMTGTYLYEFLRGETPGRGAFTRSDWIELPELIHLARRRSAYDTLGTSVIMVQMTEDGNATPQMNSQLPATELNRAIDTVIRNGFSLAWDAWIQRDNGIHYFNINTQEITNGTNT